jgi:hypothetical protein
MFEALLARWKLRAGVYEEMMKKQYDDSPETNKIIWSMHSQLLRCIEELEDVLAARSPEARLAQSVIDHIRSLDE